MELETDEKGIVTFLPIMNWAVTIVMDKTVGLAVDYYANAEDAAASRLSRIQLHLDPGPAQQLGRALEKRGDMVLGSSGAAPGR